MHNQRRGGVWEGSGARHDAPAALVAGAAAGPPAWRHPAGGRAASASRKLSCTPALLSVDGVDTSTPALSILMRSQNGCSV